MEFWGIEVKPGKPVSCDAGDECVIHISQVALGETKKGSENVLVSVKVDGKKTVIGHLSAEKHPQFMCDLVIGNEFELSHSSKTTTVFLCGYKTDMPNPYESDSGEDENEEIPGIHDIMGKHLGRTVAQEGKKDSDSDDGMNLSSSDDDDDDESSDEDDESSDDHGSDESPAELESSSSMETSDEEADGSDGEDESSSSMGSSDEEDDEEDEIPKKPESSKMTAAGPTPVSGKKSKTATPSGHKTGNKNSHVATPHPAKEVAKTPAKPNEKTPKSSGTHACKSCSKTFGSDAALQSHQKAKHPAK